MTRKECLDAAAACVLKDRACQYGGPENNFGRIALLWTDYLGVKLDAVDVAMMMALLKIARVRNNKSYEDGYIDLAGYAACGAELAGAMQAREDAVREAGEEYQRLKAEYASGKPAGFRIKSHVDKFFKAEGTEELVVDAFDEARMRESMPFIVPQDGPSDMDAPQTPEAVRRHIVEANPAVFKPRTPTGEELAEMAEEETNG